MKRLGSYNTFNEAFRDFNNKINQIVKSPFFANDFPSKKTVNITKKILESDIFFEDDIMKNYEEINFIEDILEEILNYLNEFKNIEIIWNDSCFWLMLNIFMYYWFDTILFFQEDIQNKIKSMINNIWNQIQDYISKWNTDFPIEFTLGISFLIFKEKEEILNYLHKLKENFENTHFSELIKYLTDFISLGNFPINILNIPKQNMEVKLCVTILIMKFGSADDIKIALKILIPTLQNKWNQILSRNDKLIKGSIIRDWISSKYIELLIIKKLELNFVLKIKELPYFSLSSHEFERLIYWIIKSEKKWKDVQWRGATGSERGKDIFAIKADNNNNWVIQVKRDKNFSRKDLNDEFLKVKPELEEYQSEGYLICIAKNASDGLRKAVEKLMQNNEYLIEIWDSEDLSFIIKRSPILLKEFFNYQEI